MEPRTSQVVTNALVVSGVILALLGQAVVSIVVAVLGLLLLLTGFVVQVLFWRCPHCHGYLGRPGFGRIAYCPHCGEPL